MAVFKLLVLFSRCIMLLHALLELIIINNSLCVCIYYTYICSVDHVMKEIFVYCNYWKIWLSLALQSVPNF